MSRAPGVPTGTFLLGVADACPVAGAPRPDTLDGTNSSRYDLGFTSHDPKKAMTGCPSQPVWKTTR